MNFEWFIALKHLVKGRRHGFVSLISLISILGVAVGVMALIVVLAVMSGFDRELKSKIVGVQPHLRIEGIGGIRDSTGAARRVKTLGFTDLNSISPYVEGQSIIRSDQNAVGIVVKGVDPHTEPLALFEQKMKVGTLEFTDVNASLNDNKERWIGRAVIGETLARRLKIDVGYVVTLISPALEEESLKRAVKKAKSVAFVVSGIFRVGMNDFDSGLVLVSLGRAQELFQLGERVTGMGLRLGDPNNADALKTPLRREFGASYQVRSWTDLNRTFFAALQVERTVMTILLSLIILVAAFNIVSTLIMIVMEKTRDIGVMRAIGATKSAVRSIFLIQGFVVGLIGVGLGTTAGLALAYNLNPVSDFLERYFKISVFPSDIYYFDQIPAQVNFPDVVVVVGMALLMSLLAGWYPAHRAAMLDPVQALRYE